MKCAQLKCPVYSKIVQQLRGKLDPYGVSKKKTKKPKPKAVLAPLEIAQFQLNPQDGVLERLVLFREGRCTVFCIPDACLPESIGALTWREWIFLHCHETMLNPHRKLGATTNFVKRIGW